MKVTTVYLPIAQPVRKAKHLGGQAVYHLSCALPALSRQVDSVTGTKTTKKGEVVDLGRRSLKKTFGGNVSH